VLDGIDLLDGDRRGNAFHIIDVGLLHPLQKLAGVGRERFDIASMAFGIDRIESQRRLARTAQTGDDGQGATGEIEVKVLEIMGARPANDQLLAHDSSSPCRHVLCLCSTAGSCL
jgi:hypothetical protein